MFMIKYIGKIIRAFPEKLLVVQSHQLQNIYLISEMRKGLNIFIRAGSNVSSHKNTSNIHVQTGMQEYSNSGSISHKKIKEARLV